MISADNIGSLAYYYAMIEYLSEIDARPKNTSYRLIKEKPKKKKQKPPEKMVQSVLQKKTESLTALCFFFRLRKSIPQQLCKFPHIVMRLFS